MLVVASFIAFAIAPQNLWLLVAGTMVFDLGVQAALIAHQSIIYSLEPAARSRLTALLIGAMFIGMASGSALGSMILTYAGWRGLSMFAAAAALAALLVRVWPGKSAPA
jgi:predicted MFS family arabinose efflux permease